MREVQVIGMKQSTQNAIREHALRDSPQEACGFILTVAGVERIFPVPNAHDAPRNNFTIHPASYLEAKRTGEILAVYHSHTVGDSCPTDIDRLSCNRSGLPWYVYSNQDDSFGSCLPEGRAPLLGRSFTWGVYDCWTLIFDYYQEVLAITLPDWEPYEKNFWDHGRNYYIERYAEFGFLPVEDLRPHDVLLMQLGSDIPIHAGVYQANGTVLHHVPGRLSCNDVYGNYLRTMTNRILRHRSLL
jgi:proteasome lid subunit RPN8/RPN11